MGLKLSGFQLKLIGIILMVFDHIHQYIPHMPMLLTYWGRIVAPIFMFLAIEGYHKTKNQNKYILRLLSFGCAMMVGSKILIWVLPSATTIPNNIFFSLGLSLLAIKLFENFKEKKRLTVFLPSIGIVMYFISFSEGSFLVLWIMILFYVYRQEKKKLIHNYVLASMIIGLAMTNFTFTIDGWFNEGYQWMMVFALPFILAYNGERGSNMKYFFYGFYPAHIWILYVIRVKLF